MPNKLVQFAVVVLGLSICAAAPLRAQRGGRGQVDLPDGDGKQMVQTLCVGCHGLNNITQGWGYDKMGWDQLISSMVKLPPATQNQVTTYLAANFSAKTRPATVVVPAFVRIGPFAWGHEDEGRLIRHGRTWFFFSRFIITVGLA